MIKTLGAYPRWNLIGLMAISCLLSIALVAYRIEHTGSMMYSFMYWNLFLALIPFSISFGLSILPSLSAKKLVFWPMLGLWLLFLPNAPYMTTDLFHLKARDGMPLWFDLLLILSFAWNGLILAFVSMEEMQELITQHSAPWLSWIMMIFVVFLCGIGIYLGRFLRWNSWDLWTRPEALLHDILDLFIDPLHHPRAWGLTLGYGFFLLLGYLILRSIRMRPASEQKIAQ